MAQPLLVLVTGANQGIGYYTAQHLASSGKYHVLMGARSLAKAENAAKELVQSKSIASDLLEPIEIDLNNDDSIAAAAKQVKSKHGYLDILVNNAAIANVPDGTRPRERFNLIYDTNVTGTAAVIEAFVPLLEASKTPSPGRRIVFVSTTLASMANARGGFASPEYVEYSVSKAAFNMLALNYMVKLKDKNITITLTSPGYCATNLNHYSGTLPPEEGALNIVYAVERQEHGTFKEAEKTIPW
jgi:NAD(P)-dependent dehydrogenase (short-subunit alcohol dehydrogenase family)